MLDELRGLKVIELAGVLAGPSAGMFLAEAGAEVIKIENSRNEGDVTRSWKVNGEGSGTSAYYASANLYKKVLHRDLRQQEHLQEVRQLVKQADIVLLNFRRGREKELGLDYDSLAKVNPRLIHATVTGFAGSGRPAYDVVLQAECGFMSINGEKGSRQLKLPVAFIDLFAAHQLRSAILLALYKREKTGHGAGIEVSLYKSALSALANQAATYLNLGKVPVQTGSLHPGIAPYGEMIRTKDGKWIVLAVGSDEQFRKLSGLLKRSWATLEQFSTNQKRVENRVELQEQLQEAAGDFQAAALSQMLEESGIPFGQVKKLDEVFKEPEAQLMVREQKFNDQETLKAVSTVAFEITHPS